MTRIRLIERILRLAYGEQPTDDSNITINLVNDWLNDAIAAAAKLNYKDAISLDGIGYVNNSFYSTFSGLPFNVFDQFIYSATLPQIPLGVGVNEGVSSVRIKDGSGVSSLDCIPLSENEWAIYQSMPPINNKILYKPESNFIYAISTLQLNIGFTATVTMISGGDSTNLNSNVNVPDDYISMIIDYVVQKLMQERQTPKDTSNDGSDNI